jgi:hypothetical protein
MFFPEILFKITATTKTYTRGRQGTILLFPPLDLSERQEPWEEKCGIKGP